MPSRETEAVQSYYKGKSKMAMDPLTDKGNEIMGAMQKQYGEKKGKSVFYASKNKGKISGVDNFAPAHPQKTTFDALGGFNLAGHTNMAPIAPRMPPVKGGKKSSGAAKVAKVGVEKEEAPGAGKGISVAHTVGAVAGGATKEGLGTGREAIEGILQGVKSKDSISPVKLPGQSKDKWKPGL